MHSIRNQKLVGAVASVVLLLGGMSGCGQTETSETLVAAAKQFIQKGDNKAAAIQLKNALLKNPSDVEARLTLGGVYNESADPVSAEKEFRKAMELGAATDRAAGGLTTALLAQQQFQKALEATEGAGSPELLVLRGHALLALDKRDEAKASYTQALELKPEYAPALLGMARYLGSENDLDGASRMVAQALASDPGDVEALMFKGDLLRAQKKPAEALAAYDAVLAARPAHRSANIEKASINIANGKFDAARANVAAAKKITPNNLQLMYTEALLEHSDGKHAAAREIIQKVLKGAPEHLPSNLLAGSIEHALGSTQAAERYLRKYVNSVPGHVFARKQLASTLLKLGQTKEAITVLEPLMANADAQALALAGEAAMQSRDFSKASEYYEKAAKLAPQVAQLRTSLAVSRLAQGDAARAITDLEESTKLDASSTKTGALLIVTEMRLKRFDKALAAVSTLEAQQPKEAMVQNLKGGVLLAMGNAAGARAAFEKALALNPTFFPAAANLAELAMREKDPARAKKVFLDVLQHDKKSVEAMSGLSQFALYERKPAEATQWLEKALAENPDAVAPAVMLGSRYLATGAKDKALTLARKFQVANPTNPQVLELLSKAQLAKGDTNGALESYGKLVALMPESAPVRYRMASMHMQAKNTGAAAEELKKALSINPNYLEAQIALAELAVLTNKPDDGIAIARQIQKQRAKNPAGFLLEANLMQAQRKPALAIAPYERALALAPTSSNLLLLHAAMTSAGKVAEAEARLAKWQKEHKPDLTMKMYLSERALAKKDYKEAISVLEGVVQEVPKNPIVLNNLAWSYQQMKDPRALKTAEQALALAPDSPAVLDTLGNLLVEQGNAARGIPHLQKAAQLAPQDAAIRFHLAQGLAKSGDKAGARKELEKVMTNKSFNGLEEARALYKQL